MPRVRIGHSPLRASIVVAIALVASFVIGVGSAQADTIFSDGFESSNFSAWSAVLLGGDGTAGVQSAIVKTGSFAAQLSESSSSTSKAAVRKSFSAAQLDLTATGDFQVLKEGASGGNVPFFRFLDSTGTRIISVYRQNGTSGMLGVGYGSSHFSTSGTLALNTWATISVHVIINASGSTVQVSLNGTQVYQTTAASLGGAGVSTVQIGNDTAGQTFTIVADAISVQNAATAPSPPVNTGLPGISGVPQAGQTLSASTGTWTGTQPITYAYQWLSCGASGGNCVPIAGATAATYAVTSADLGETLRVAVTATNSVGSQSATSTATTVVQSASAPPSNSGLPTIVGTATAGQVLNANPGTWNGTQPITYAYQWLRCDPNGANCNTPIAGATNAAYTVATADVGSTLAVAVTATNSVGTANADSQATAVVQGSSTQSNLVALWHMDETSGTTMNDAFIGSDGVLHNGTLYNIKLGLPGFAGSAYGFNGSNSYVSVPSASVLNPGSANVTVTIHIQTTGTPPPAPSDWDIIRKGVYSSTGGEFKMEFQQAGQASCGFNGSSNYSELIAGPKINDGRWHTVQCVKTATAIELVVDGATYSQAANIGSITDSDPVIIGSHPGSDWYSGALDEASLQIG